MPINAACVWEIRADATANNVNGGFFRTGATGTDYSRQPAAQYAISFTSAGAGSTIACATASADMVGNGLRTTGGTNVTNNMWFEITSVVVGVSITVSTNAAGTAICTGAAVGGTANVGGALSMNSTLDDDVLEQAIGGNSIWIRGASGTVTLGESIAIGSTTATADAPIQVRGYATTRGDRPLPSSSSIPTVACGANSVTFAAWWNIYNISFTGTASAVVSLATNSFAYQCKFLNTSTTADRSAVLGTATRGFFIFCEAISCNGAGISANVSNLVFGCFAHDSKDNISLSSNTSYALFSVAARSTRNGIRLGTSATGSNTVINCTVVGYNLTPPISQGIYIPPAGSGPGHKIINNIVTRYSAGIAKDTLDTPSNLVDNNNVFECTTNYSNVTNLGGYTLDPQFLDTTELSGSTASTSTTTLTQIGADFSSVVDGKHFIYVISGTGVTVGIYPIVSHTTTTITSSNSFGTSGASDVVWEIGIGNDYRPGVNMKGLALPVLYGADSANALDLGAVQRREPNLSMVFG